MMLKPCVPGELHRQSADCGSCLLAEKSRCRVATSAMTITRKRLRRVAVPAVRSLFQAFAVEP